MPAAGRAGEGARARQPQQLVTDGVQPLPEPAELVGESEVGLGRVVGAPAGCVVHAGEDAVPEPRTNPYGYRLRITDWSQPPAAPDNRPVSSPQPYCCWVGAGEGSDSCAGCPEGAEVDVSERAIPSFVHHRARLTAGQQRAWERWWPVLGHEVADLVSGAEPFDPPAWFGRSAPLLLEIGPGMGETTVALAAAAPDVDHLAVEVFEPGLAQLLMRITELGLRNVVPLRGDAVALLADRVPPDSLDGIRVFFPDPWPKRRHHKRRLIQPGFVALAARRLRPGGTLHLATDWPDYAGQMREVCDAEPMLANTAGPEGGGGWAPRPEWRPVTKFEQRARAEGRPVRDLIYRRSSISEAPLPKPVPTPRNVKAQPSDHAR